MENIPKKEFAEWAIEKSGFKGGDIGSPDRRSIWICGIEEGGEYGCDDSQETLEKKIKQDLEKKETLGLGYENNYDRDYMNSKDFDKGVLKLINAFQKYKIKDYKSDNWEDYKKKLPCKPFVNGDKKRFFKINLFPVASSNEKQWNEHVQKVTGFNSKEALRKWCRGNSGSKDVSRQTDDYVKSRFDSIRYWVEIENKPKLIICFGRGYISDFKKVFLTNPKESVKPITICGRKLEIYKDEKSGRIVAICPFPTTRGKYSLNPKNDDLIQEFGDRIRGEFDK